MFCGSWKHKHISGIIGLLQGLQIMDNEKSKSVVKFILGKINQIKTVISKTKFDRAWFWYVFNIMFIERKTTSNIEGFWQT